MKHKIIFALIFGILVNCGMPAISIERISSTSIYNNYQTMGLKAAESEYKKLIKKNSKDEAAYVDMAYIYVQEEQPEKVIKVGLAGTKKIPDAYVLYNFMGMAYKSLNKIDEAIWAYSKSIDSYPSEPPYFNRGKILYSQKDYNKAISDFTKAIEYLNKDMPTFDNENEKKAYNERFYDAYAYRAYAYYDSKNFAKAIADLNAALKYDEKNPYGYLNRATFTLFKLIEDGKNGDISNTTTSTVLKSVVSDLDTTMKYARESNNADLYNEALQKKKSLYEIFGSKK